MTKLTLHTNDIMKDQFTPKCTIQLDNEKVVLTDFVVVGFSDKTSHVIYQNTDALTLGVAQKLLSMRFVEAYNKLSDVDKASIDEEIDRI